MTQTNEAYWLYVGEDDPDSDESGYLRVPSERELSWDDPPE